MSPLIFIIFGATGDLTKSKLMPAIVSLVKKGKISPDVVIIGTGRRKLSDEEFRDSLSAKAFPGTIKYVQGLFEDPALYRQIGEELEFFDKKAKRCIPRYFYLATLPSHYEEILNHLKLSALAKGCGQEAVNYTRVLIEKPFGKDMQTAQKLDEVLASVFEERQIYRIDHYLAKDTVQNILAFRFANGIFEPTWNGEFIDHVQISVSEDIGVTTRGNLYEGIGALCDVMQNHMMQMLSLIAMEQPRAFDAVSIRDERARVIAALAPIDAASLQNVVRGQYQGYRSEEGVAPDSATDTFVAMKVMINTPRWRHVPFYLRTGKKLKDKVTEISIHYKKPALCYEDVCLFDPDNVYRNVLRIRIQPDEEISLRLMVKKPGFGMELVPVQMNYQYKSVFSEIDTPDAYEKLLIDAIAGDQTLFARTDEIQASWKFISPILNAWKNDKSSLVLYEEGGVGPRQAMTLIENDGRTWFFDEK
jgi:glucose-6-phosphate 1-dehydrogenase